MCQTRASHVPKCVLHRERRTRNGARFFFLFLYPKTVPVESFYLYSAAGYRLVSGNESRASTIYRKGGFSISSKASGKRGRIQKFRSKNAISVMFFVTAYNKRLYVGYNSKVRSAKRVKIYYISRKSKKKKPPFGFRAI